MSKATRGGKRQGRVLLWSPCRECGPADTLIQDFWRLEAVFRHPVCGHSLWPPQDPQAGPRLHPTTTCLLNLTPAFPPACRATPLSRHLFPLWDSSPRGLHHRPPGPEPSRRWTPPGPPTPTSSDSSSPSNSASRVFLGHQRVVTQCHPGNLMRPWLSKQNPTVNAIPEINWGSAHTDWTGDAAGFPAGPWSVAKGERALAPGEAAGGAGDSSSMQRPTFKRSGKGNLPVLPFAY